MDEIDKVQQNNLLPFEQSKKDEVVQSLQRNVDDIGITLQWWMNDFRKLKQIMVLEQLSDDIGRLVAPSAKILQDKILNIVLMK